MEKNSNFTLNGLILTLYYKEAAVVMLWLIKPL